MIETYNIAALIDWDAVTKEVVKQFKQGKATRDFLNTHLDIQKKVHKVMNEGNMHLSNEEEQEIDNHIETVLYYCRTEKGKREARN